MKHNKFSDIGQFRNVVRDIKHAAQFVGMDEDGEVIMNRDAEMPTVSFHGSIKSHGTNAGCAMDKDDNIWYQGRKQIITPEKDNAGCAFFMESKKDILKGMLLDIREKNGLTSETIIIYGEWCGGNIQNVKDLAIRNLDKMLMIFAVKVLPLDEDESNYYLTRDKWSHYKSPENRIYNVEDYETFDIDIDFSRPDKAVEELTNITIGVEKECPIGKAFGVSGIGEGVVYVGYYKNTRYVFKVKGDKHSSSKSRNKSKLAPVDVEKMNSIKEFVEYAVTKNRLNQAIEQVFTSNAVEASRKGTGDFLKWLVTDIAKEEMDTMTDNNLEPKDVNKHLSEKARKWFFNKLDAEVGL